MSEHSPQEPQPPVDGDGNARDSGDEKPSHKKPTVWIVLAGVLALVAIGLGIWAYSANSDLDDAQATVDEQNEQIAAAEEKGTEAVAGAKTAYDDVNAELQKSESELDDATDAAADAQGEKEKADAELKEAEASAETAKSCAQAAIEAFGQVFDAPSLEEGIDAAVAEFQKLKPTCKGVLGD